MLTPETRAKLQRVSTATLANSDYLIQIINGNNEKTQKQFIVKAKK